MTWPMRDQRGVTLVEMLVTVLVVVVLAGALLPRLSTFVQRSQLSSAKEELVSALRLAQTRSAAGDADDSWGVHLVPGVAGSFTLFKGDDFGTRDASYDLAYDLPGSLSLAETVTGSDVLFTRAEGGCTTPGTVTITWDDGGIDKGADVNALGAVDPF